MRTEGYKGDKSKYEIIEYSYNNISNVDKCLLDDLLHSVWNDIDTTEIHPQEMDARSFCAVANNMLIGYVGVIMWNIRVRDKMFNMCGLSCVCTRPSYRKNGVGSGLVKKANKWIMQNDNFDVGLFTCSQENASFYEKVGFWQRSPGLILKESDRKGAYKSDIMGLNVFKLLVSHKARLYANYFENGIITLNFPKGKFI